MRKAFIALSAKQDAAMRQACEDTNSAACRGHVAAALEGSGAQMELVAAGNLPANYCAGADLNAQATRLARNVIAADIRAACLADLACRQKQDNINGALMLGTIGLITAPMLPSLGSDYCGKSRDGHATGHHHGGNRSRAGLRRGQPRQPC